MEGAKEVLFRTDSKNAFVTNALTGALYFGLGAALATQASRIHKYAPLAITGAFSAAELIDSKLDGHDHVRKFTTNQWGLFLPMMSGFLVVGSAISAWQTFPLARHVVRVGAYNLASAKDLAMKAGPEVLSALTIGYVYANRTKSNWRVKNVLDTLGLYRRSKPAQAANV